MNHMLHDNVCLKYRIDADNRLVYLDEHWHEFANENKAEGLTPEVVLNRSLLDFIDGSSIRNITEQVLDKVRARHGSVHLPFRCDSPDKRRYMQLLITPLEDGAVEFNSCLLREVKRDKVALLDSDAGRSDKFVTICSWCNKVQVSQVDWMELEDAIHILQLFSSDIQPQLTHGICPACYEKIRGELKNQLPVR